MRERKFKWLNFSFIFGMGDKLTKLCQNIKTHTAGLHLTGCEHSEAKTAFFIRYYE